MLTTIVAVGVALVVGMAIGWAVSAGRIARTAAERDAARTERARSDIAVEHARKRIEEAQQARAAADARAAHIEQSREEMRSVFVNEAHRAFTQVSESLVNMNKQQVDCSLDVVLKPLREMLESYRGELATSENARNSSYGGLQEQIRTLLTAQELAQREASRLANALQSPTVRGSWGEISLRRCVELAGMTEYCDFFVQETIETDEGRRLRPDMLIRLPNNRVIAVDSKAPITVATDEDQRQAVLRRHVESLSRKEYQTALGDGLDFVVMFVPGEQFLPNDGDLFEFAAQRKIFVASPAILIPLLRAVDAGWKAEKTEENAKRMHDAGVELFNRFVRVMELITEVGARLGKTVEKYNEAIRSIDSRLWPKGEEMQRMAGSGKDLGELSQLEAVPLQSSKLRLTMQSEDEGVVVPITDR
jgi:DNA recombination protein RmuC